MLPSIETKTKDHVTKLFEQADLSTLFYHNYHHTVEVVDRIGFLSKKLDAEQACFLRIAGWFHDVGYLYGYHNHEDRGMLIAKEYLETQGLNESCIQSICGCIEATKLSLQPRNNLEEIMKDADIGFGVTDNFFETGPRLRQEWEAKLDKFYSDLDWEKLQYNFLLGVKFYSPFAKLHYSPILAQNILQQQKKLKPV